MNIDDALSEDRIFLHVPEVAAVFRKDGRTIRNGIKDGSIPAVRIGRGYCIPAAWVRQQVNGGDDE